MRLPADAIIVEDKLTRYLLLPQARGDKSTFPISTIWMTEHLSGITKFVTLIPDKRRT